MEIIISILSLSLLGITFGVTLAFFARIFHVKVDERLEKIHSLLPGANCGACGAAGCFGFAEKIVSGETLIDNCRVASDDTKEAIAKILGRSLKKTDKLVARLHCCGGKNAKDKFVYHGINDCSIAHLVLGGFKQCPVGCLGLGSCLKVCPFGALSMSSDNLPVVDIIKCKACNKCVETCPRKLFSLKPLAKTVWVACCLHYSGKDTRAVCQTGCIACKLCQKSCPTAAINIIDNLAVIDYTKCTSCGACVKICPSKCILQTKQNNSKSQENIQ
ncbi:MAG: RnfABCDGE type electron transport complex subunit B [Candidatus Omnitrophica bacterium]|nr:RnfABCDGE type electron transport complex subunit B [Candidatus Omnitrophota bacterium]